MHIEDAKHTTLVLPRGGQIFVFKSNSKQSIP